MVRTIALLGLGILAGVLLGHVLARQGPMVAASTVPAAEQVVTVTSGAVPGGDPSRSEEGAADATEELLAELERLARLPASPARNRALGDQLVFLGRRDAALAADRALALGLRPPFVASALARLALVDGDGALVRFGEIVDPLVRRETAVALARAFGGDAEALARVVEALPQGVAATVIRTDFYAAIAADDPDGALLLALGEPEAGARLDALRHVAAIWATRAPREALARLGRIADPALAEHFERTVMNVWARADPAGALARLDERRFEVAASASVREGEVLSWATQGDPAEAFAWARRQGARDRGLLELVLDSWARRDPDAALAAWETQLDEDERRRTRDLLLRSIAAVDPPRAVAMAEGLNEGRDEALVAVINGMRDVSAAMAAIERVSHPTRRQEALRDLAMRTGVQGGQEDARLLAQRMLASSEPAAAYALQMLLNSWSQRSPRAALDWFEATSDAPAGRWLAGAAGALAVEDLRRADRLLESRDADQQPGFLADMLGAMARRDLDAAVRAVDRYAGRPGHDEGVRRVATHLAADDPARAVALVEDFGGLDPEGVMASQIASGWARVDAAAAFAWAEDLDEREGRAAATDSTFSYLALAEPGAARTWAARQPSGADRDRYFAQLYSFSVMRGATDASLLQEIDDEAVRTAAAQSGTTAGGANLAIPTRSLYRTNAN